MVTASCLIFIKSSGPQYYLASRTPKAEFDLKAQGVVVKEFLVGQIQIGAEQNHMGLLPGGKVGSEDDHDVDWKSKLTVAQCGLVDLGTNACIGVICFQVFLFIGWTSIRSP